MLNFIFYPVSFILWVWHEVFGFLLGPDNGVAWALSVMFLVFTLRAILYKPFVHQYIALSQDLASYLRHKIGVPPSRVTPPTVISLFESRTYSVIILVIMDDIRYYV